MVPASIAISSHYSLFNLRCMSYEVPHSSSGLQPANTSNHNRPYREWTRRLLMAVRYSILSNLVSPTKIALGTHGLLDLSIRRHTFAARSLAAGKFPPLSRIGRKSKG
jgi:hypothetical protein